MKPSERINEILKGIPKQKAGTFVDMDIRDLHRKIDAVAMYLDEQYKNKNHE